MVVQTEEILFAELKELYKPINVNLVVGIHDKRIDQFKASAEIQVKPVVSKGLIEVVVEELESEYIYVEQGESIYSSFGIDEQIGIYDEVLATIPVASLLGQDNWQAEIDVFLTEESLAASLGKLLNDYRFTDPSGKYRFRKLCTVKEFLR